VSPLIRAASGCRLSLYSRSSILARDIAIREKSCCRSSPSSWCPKCRPRWS
jgi:hypothetical protein